MLRAARTRGRIWHLPTRVKPVGRSNPLYEYSTNSCENAHIWRKSITKSGLRQFKIPNTNPKHETFTSVKQDSGENWHHIATINGPDCHRIAIAIRHAVLPANPDRRTGGLPWALDQPGHAPETAGGPPFAAARDAGVRRGEGQGDLKPAATRVSPAAPGSRSTPVRPGGPAYMANPRGATPTASAIPQLPVQRPAPTVHLSRSRSVPNAQGEGKTGDGGLAVIPHQEVGSTAVRVTAPPVPASRPCPSDSRRWARRRCRTGCWRPRPACGGVSSRRSAP